MVEHWQRPCIFFVVTCTWPSTMLQLPRRLLQSGARTLGSATQGLAELGNWVVESIAVVLQVCGKPTNATSSPGLFAMCLPVLVDDGPSHEGCFRPLGP